MTKEVLDTFVLVAIEPKTQPKRPAKSKTTNMVSAPDFIIKGDFKRVCFARPTHCRSFRPAQRGYTKGMTACMTQEDLSCHLRLLSLPHLSHAPLLCPLPLFLSPGQIVLSSPHTIQGTCCKCRGVGTPQNHDG